MAILLAIVCVFIALYYLYSRSFNYFKSRGVPYEKSQFLLGSFHEVLIGKKHFSTKIRELYNKFKDEPYFGTFILNQPNLFIRDPELVKKITVKDFDKFMDIPVASNESVDPIAFHNLPSAKGKTWRNLRSKLSPIFTSGKMKLMLPLMKDVAEDLMTFFKKHEGEELDMLKTMKKYSIDIISSCAFGINSNCLKQENSEIFKKATNLLDLKSFKRNFSIMCFFFMPKLVDILRVTFLDQNSTDFFIGIFKNTAKTREEKKIVRNDLIDLLTNLKKKETANDDYKFDDVKMASQAIMFFSAGNETTSLALSFVLSEIAQNKEIQDRLREEIVETFEKHEDFTYEALQEMKYLDMVWKEGLRKYPLATFLNRKCLVDYPIEETGFVIEKDLTIRIPVAAFHYDPAYFSDPESFIPERFSDENKHKIKPYTYLPFGEGPRACIGERFSTLTGKLALARIIKDFILELSEKTIMPLELDPASIFMTSKHGIYLRVNKI